MRRICGLPAPPTHLGQAGDGMALALEGGGGLRVALDGQAETMTPGKAPAGVEPEDSVDIYGNAWRLGAGSQGAVCIEVSAAGQPDTWQTVPAPAGWSGAGGRVLADAVGMVWVGGPGGLWFHDPHEVGAGWRAPGRCDALPRAAVTALTRSPDGLALAGFASGELVEVDVTAAGEVLAQSLGRLPGAVRGAHTDWLGQVWAATDDALFRGETATGAWQHAWEPRARLPGGNHDLFALEMGGRLWMAGGLTSGWGYPARTHVFDEVFTYDPVADRWEVVARMPFPRCYSGIALLEGQIWMVGGAANLGDPGNPDGRREPLDDVRIYDPERGTWERGPSLREKRLEPLVLEAGGRIYCIGGSNGETLRAVESIGPGEAAWRPEAPLPVPLSQADGCVVDGICYCIGRPGLLALDPREGRWRQDLPQLVESPQAAQVAAHRGEVWVMGGSRRRDTHIYSPGTRAWRDGPDLPTDQSWGAAAEVGGRLIVAGGAHWSEGHGRYEFDDRAYALR